MKLEDRIRRVLDDFEAMDYRKRRAVSAEALADAIRECLPRPVDELARQAQIKRDHERAAQKAGAATPTPSSRARWLNRRALGSSWTWRQALANPLLLLFEPKARP